MFPRSLQTIEIIQPLNYNPWVFMELLWDLNLSWSYIVLIQDSWAFFQVPIEIPGFSSFPIPRNGFVFL